MTKKDFILSVVTSFIATILFELARTLYPRLKRTRRTFVSKIKRRTNDALVKGVVAFHVYKKFARKYLISYQGVASLTALLVALLYIGLKQSDLKQYESQLNDSVLQNEGQQLKPSARDMLMITRRTSIRPPKRYSPSTHSIPVDNSQNPTK